METATIRLYDKDQRFLFPAHEVPKFTRWPDFVMWGGRYFARWYYDHDPDYDAYCYKECTFYPILDLKMSPKHLVDNLMAEFKDKGML